MTGITRCWSEIGTAGDRTCPKLAAHLLCSNCGTFAAAARSLLDRPAPEGYVEDWTRWIAGEPIEDTIESVSLCPFRLGPEWFALPTGRVSETVAKRPIRRVPHRSTDEFLGLINVRGELVLCFSLHTVLSVADVPATPAGPRLADDHRALMLVCGEGRRRVAFPADEAAGVRKVPAANLRPPPATVSRAGHALTAHLIDLPMGPVAILDADRLMQRIETVLQ